MAADLEHAIAIVGMAARLPGATTPDEFWRNLTDGVESITTLTDDELLAAGVRRESLLRPGYVRRAALLDRMDWFDAEFFGFSPKDAAIMDPQHRQFLEVCWEALEDAAHPPSRFDGAIGVFGGCGMGAYFAFNLLSNPALVDDVGMFLLRHTGNDKDFLVTRASYLLDLQGPAINVQTACSTSLVATHLAVQHLLSGECDMALAGGVTIEIPHGRGYQYEPGEILSPDGHCRAFDASAGGTVFGSGAGVVVLRRATDAIADGDHIYALIRGTAVNNDGARKVGYLAPSVDGQAACIAEALAVADVPSQTVQYVECHGTGTAMGDPIEVTALRQAFTPPTDGEPYCGIGSVKTNIGHLDTAAGVAALIKTSLALHHGQLPPSLHYAAPNPNIPFAGSPFEVVDTLREWPSTTTPRRAGVNSLGVGGTNAFAVLEEAPPSAVSAPPVGPQLLALSARNRAALDDAARRLAAHLRRHPDTNLADVAFTLHEGRHPFTERRVVAAATATEAADLLEALDPRRTFAHTAAERPPATVFLLPGGGAQYAGMAAGLYAAHPLFRQLVDEGIRLAETVHGLALRPLLFPTDAERADADAALQHASDQLPALLIVEHALAHLLISWGIRPDALIGHSVGENIAACIAGTMSFADCLGLVVLRGRLMDRTRGGMLAVPLTPAELQPLLDEFGLDLAVVNAADLCVASGTDEGLAALQARLAELGVEASRVRIHIAAHSRLLEPVLDEFRTFLHSIPLAAPTVPWVSNRTGTWVTDAQATDPEYWVGQLRHSVQFADGVATLAARFPSATFVEIGPGKTLSSLVRLSPAIGAGQQSVHTMRHPDETVDDETVLLTALGRLWAAGGTFPAAQAYTHGRRQRLRLPTYAFQSQRYFIEPGDRRGADDELPLLDRQPPEHWWWEPTWVQAPIVEQLPGPFTYLVFADQLGVADGVVERLRAAGHRVAVVRMGDSYQLLGPTEYVLAAEHGRPAYDQLLSDLVRNGVVPDRVLNLALLADKEDFRPGLSFFHRNQELGFYHLVFLLQAWATEGLRQPLHLVVATANAQQVLATDTVRWPEQSTVLGPVLVLPHELPDVTAVAVDVTLAPTAARRSRRGAHPAGDGIASLVERFVTEALAPPAEHVAAWRDGVRLARTHRRAALGDEQPLPLRRGGVVLITGGLGGIGLAIARELHDAAAARLVLLSRSPLPPEAQWPELRRSLGDDHPVVQRIEGLRALRAAGADVTVLTADVTNIAQMRDTIAQIIDTAGGLHGVVHAAGVTDDRALLEKQQLDLERVLAAKVYGTLVVHDVTAHLPLDLFVVFSSTSTVTGPPGQIDYVAANSFLDAFAAAHPQRVRSIGWGAWADVGMAVEAVRRLFTEGEGRPQPCAGPLFTTVTTGPNGERTFEARWPATTWFLDEHRTAAGQALLPGAAYPELARQALREAGIVRPFELRDLVLLAPLPVTDGGAVGVRATLTPTDHGFSLEVRHAVDGPIVDTDAGGSSPATSWVRTAQAQLMLRPVSPAPSVDVAAAVAACGRRGPLRGRQQDHLRFGPRWHVATRVHHGDGRIVAELRTAADAEHAAEYALDPALLDIGLCAALEVVPGYSADRLWVPLSLASLVVHTTQPLVDSTVIAEVVAGSSEQAGFATFDVRFVASDGTVQLTAEGFTMKRLDGPLELGTEPGDTVADAGAGQARRVSRAELVFRHNVEQGITAAEGATAFRRALTCTAGSQLLISSLDLDGLQRQMDAVSALSLRAGRGDATVGFARPQMDAEFVAPRDATETMLAALWQELLGIEQIGVHDNFFDLGGHSLIAVRLFARIRKLFSVDLPISALFTAPTIEAGATLIRSLVPDGEGASAPSLPSHYTHLVPMHPRDNGTTTPFFLVAGMFGNVLNLRHLANQIGGDRPFYGLQARGLFGGSLPHETFEEMAAAYLAEVREVQPHGPYLLGGFSGGGVTALEMARQLLAEGEQVALLALLDTPAPAIKQPLRPLDRVAIQWQNLRRDGLHYVSTWWRNRRAWQHEVAAKRDATTPDDARLHNVEIEQAFYRALSRYEMRYYPGTITLYRPPQAVHYRLPGGRLIDNGRNFVLDDNGWTGHCARLDLVKVPGDHDSMVLEPHVRVLAGHIRQAIDAAEAAPHPAT